MRQSTCELLLADWTIHSLLTLLSSPCSLRSHLSFWSPSLLRGLTKRLPTSFQDELNSAAILSLSSNSNKSFEAARCLRRSFVPFGSSLKSQIRLEIVLQNRQDKSRRVSIYPLLLLLCMNFLDRVVVVGCPVCRNGNPSPVISGIADSSEAVQQWSTSIEF